MISNADFNDVISLQRVALEQMRVAGMYNIAENTRLSVEPAQIIEGLVAKIESFVLTERLLSDTQQVSWTVETPTSTWQFFKQQHKDSWWLGWFVRRCAVKSEVKKYSKEFSFERYAMFPHASIPTDPYLGSPVIVEKTDLPNPRERGTVQPWRY